MIQPTITPRPPSQVWLSLILLVTTGVLLSISTSLAKLAAGIGLNPLAFLTWSAVGAAAVLAITGAARRRLPPFNPRTIEYFVVAGLISFAAPNLLFFAAVPRVGASFVALAIAFPPLFTYLGALLLGMERFQLARALGVVLALLGAALLALYKLAEPNAAPLWVIATLSGPLLLAGGNLYRTLRWPPGAAPDTLAPGMLAASALLLLLVGVLVPGVWGTSTSLSLTMPVDRIAPFLLIFAQTVTFSAQYVLFFRLQQRGGPVYLSLLGSVAAIIGVPIAVVILGEAVPQGLAVGGVLIAVGVALLTLGGVKAVQPMPRTTSTIV